LGAAAARAQAGYVPAMPADMNQVDVYLLTVSSGDNDVSSLYGHTILRVVDHASGRDMNFNWGIFDFNDPMFVWTFYVGHLNY